jgi:hypothetical protein
MSSAASAHTATIIQFPVRRAADNRLTKQDRIDVAAWRSSAQIVQCGLSSKDQHDPELGDYISIYRGTCAWAIWGVARRGNLVSMWRCATGADVGVFATMKEALAVIPLTIELPIKALA